MPPINHATYDISMEEISYKMTQDIPLCDGVELICTGEIKQESFLDKRGNILFSPEEKATILNKQMATDKSTNIVQNILKKQFPKIARLQDTIIGKTQVFDIIMDMYIQIPHTVD